MSFFLEEGKLIVSRKVLSVVLVTVALLVSGCGTVQTYDGPKRAAHEVSVLKTNVGELTLDTTWIGQIDGKELVLAYSVVEIMPGRRSLRVNFKRGFIARSETVPLDARAGRTYRLKGELSSGKLYAWIEDESTGEVVAGVKP